MHFSATRPTLPFSVAGKQRNLFRECRWKICLTLWMMYHLPVFYETNPNRTASSRMGKKKDKMKKITPHKSSSMMFRARLAVSISHNQQHLSWDCGGGGSGEEIFEGRTAPVTTRWWRWSHLCAIFSEIQHPRVVSKELWIGHTNFPWSWLKVLCS